VLYLTENTFKDENLVCQVLGKIFAKKNVKRVGGRKGQRSKGEREHKKKW